MKAFHCLLVLLVVSSTLCNPTIDSVLDKFMDKSPKELFKVYHMLFKKDYELNSETGLQRYRIFKRNVEKIKAHNAKNLSWKEGINQFTDLTPEEFTEKHLLNSDRMEEWINTMNIQGEKFGPVPKLSARPNVNHRDKTPKIRDQGSCGSCWAFATAGAIESAFMGKTKQPISLAPQVLVDCDNGNGGCNGGWYNNAFDYVKRSGLVDEDKYPYKGVKSTCKAYQATHKIDNWKYCNSCSDDQFYSMLQISPLAIAIDANPIMSYKNGIIDVPKCGQINHAVIAVGWETDSSGEILHVRNSWGTWWGENGYMRMRINNINKTCSATNYAYYAEVSGSPGPTPPPPPPPTGCFNPSSHIVNDKWKLPNTFMGSVKFTAKGISFIVNLLERPASDSRVAYSIYVAAGNANTFIVPGGTNTAKCVFPHSLDPNVKYNYRFAFNKQSGAIQITINDVTFTCAEAANAAIGNYISFSTNGSCQSQICDVTPCS